MGAYILRRLLFVIPTLIGILFLNFIIIQFAPGGPVERVMAELHDVGGDATSRFTSSSDAGAATAGQGEYRGAQGLDEQYIAQLKADFGLDKPAYERFFIMLVNYIQFDFGESFFKSGSVSDILISKLPVSLTLGLWTMLLVYMISIPLGIRKAIRDGSAFDTWTSGVIIVAYSIPSFLVAVLLLVYFAGGSFWQIFPLRGLGSENWEELSVMGKILDYLWHIVLPVTSMVISGFATLTMLTKNSFLDEIKKQYVITARAKGLTERRVLYGHVFRNAMLIVIAGFPAAFFTVFTTGSLLIESIFNLDGIGLLGFEAVVDRDYPIIFGTLFIFSLVGLVSQLITDITYTLIDPRIDFESRQI